MPKAFDRIVATPPGEKPLCRCSRCLMALPLEAFSKSSWQKNGLRSACRTCQAERDRARRVYRLKQEDAASLPGEVWRHVPGYEGLYEVSSLGRVRALAKRIRTRGGYRSVPDIVLSPGKDRRGYLRVTLTRDGSTITRQVHRLVAIAFIGAPPFAGAQARHLDGDPGRNTPDNLAWGTSKENAADKIAHGRQPSGTRSHNARFTKETLALVRAELAAGKGPAEVARIFGVHRETIAFIADGRSYREDVS